MKKITPSKFEYFEGLRNPPDDRFTVEQRRAVKNIDARPSYGVRIGVDRARLSEGVDIVTYHCPLLATTATGRLVITPSGLKKWIDRVGMNT